MVLIPQAKPALIYTKWIIAEETPSSLSKYHLPPIPFLVSHLKREIRKQNVNIRVVVDELRTVYSGSEYVG